MATIEQLKQQIDLHDLADKLGLVRPESRGNYRSPKHDDKSPSLSIYGDNKKWKDYSSASDDAFGSCLDLVMYVEDIHDVKDAVSRLHEIYSIPMDTHGSKEKKQATLAEHIAFESMKNADLVIPYLVEKRFIREDVVREAISRKAVGYNEWRSDTKEAGSFGHGGPAAAFIVHSMNPGHVMAVDLRYFDADLNGGTKTMCQGEKIGHLWFTDLNKLKRAHSVYVVESPINVLSIESCKIPGVCAVAVRSLMVDAIDWRWLQDKRVVICMDNDLPDPKQNNQPPGKRAAWRLHEILTSLNIAAHLVNQDEWEHNDVNDWLQADKGDSMFLRTALQDLEQCVIPGMPGNYNFLKGGRPRVFLPKHDYAQYWRYRAKEDFTTVESVKKDQDGNETKTYSDICGFRVAGLSRVTISSAVSVMSGEEDSQPNTLFAVTVQAARHGNKLIRRVFEDERLHNVDQWQKFGPIFSKGRFQRMVNILERGANLGARDAVNFVGVAWRNGKLIVNEGPDCYFTDPQKQCPYHNLIFPSGSAYDARRVIEAYQSTFTNNAAMMMLAWGLGGHLKAHLGFYPHMVMQADKGSGKSTLIKRMERSIAFTMFSGQSLQTEFRLLTSISHTSHPVGWEEISARRSDVIDKAVSMLQESYQFSVTRRGSEMTEYMQCAPVLLAGEDVPVDSLLGKVVRTDLTDKKGPMMPENLPRFPVRQWLTFVAGLDRMQVRETYAKVSAYCHEQSCAATADDGATRMVGNYAAIITAWRFLCEFAGIDRSQGNFIYDAITEMNTHISDTEGAREPWVWIISALTNEISTGNFRAPFTYKEIQNHENGESTMCLCIRTKHIMHHISTTMSLRDMWNALPVKSDRVLKRQLVKAGVLHNDDVEVTINKRREGHLVAISLDRLAHFGLHVSLPDDDYCSHEN